MKLLVAHGAEVTCKDKKSYTPLHAAASSGMISVVKYLLDLGVDVRKNKSDTFVVVWNALISIVVHCLCVCLWNGENSESISDYLHVLCFFFIVVLFLLQSFISPGSFRALQFLQNCLKINLCLILFLFTWYFWLLDWNSGNRNSVPSLATHIPFELQEIELFCLSSL